MAQRLLAVFDEEHQAVAALAALEQEGISRSNVTIMSSEPLHLSESDYVPGRTHIKGFAIAGGIIGAACALLLTVDISRRVDLITGGMPTLTWWAFGIIIFELTALGAILASLARMIWEARLARWSALSDYDPRVSDGKVAVSFECPEANVDSARSVLDGAEVIEG
jgi:hypothetical protein